MQFISKKTKDGEEVQMISKLEAVQENMEEFIAKIVQAQEINERRLKPLKIEWNTRIYSRIECVLLKLQRPMLHAQALELSAEELYEIYDSYSELCCWIEEETNISYYKSKPEFCNFAAITTNSFERLKTEGDPSQREAVNDIDTRIANSVLVAAENNKIRGKSAEFRLGAKGGVGHGIRTANSHEQAIVIPVSAKNFTPIAEITPPSMPQQIGKGSK